MSHEPCTLFCSRSGFTPTPSRPMLPVAMARLAMPITMVEPWLCSVTPRPYMMVALRALAYRRVAARTSAAGMPVISSTASGLCSGAEMNRSHSAKSSQRSSTNARSTRPSVTTTWPMALISATLVPGPHPQVVLGLDVRGAHQVDPARVGDDELGALAQPALDPRAEHRVGVGRVRPHDQDDVGLVHGLEVLGAGRRAVRLLEAVAGRGVADAGAGVHVVVACLAWMSSMRLPTWPMACSHSTSRQGSVIRSVSIGLSRRSGWEA